MTNFFTIQQMKITGSIVLVIALLLVFVGIGVLMTKEQNKAIFCMALCSMGVLIMDASSLIIINTQNFEVVSSAFKIQYLGNAIFFYFFLQFVATYSGIVMQRKHLAVGPIIEAIVIPLIWINNTYAIKLLELPVLIGDEQENIYRAHNGLFLHIRYVFIVLILTYTWVRTIYRIRVVVSKRAKLNMLRISVAVFAALLGVLVITFWRDYSMTILPLAVSVSLLILNIGVVRGQFFSVTDRGRTWLLDHVDDAFIIVNDQYGYLDSNKAAKETFPELNHLRRNDKVSDTVIQLIKSKEVEVEIKEKTYERMIKHIKQKDMIEGFCLYLVDITEQHRLMDEIRVEKNRAEEANEAKSAFMSNMSHEIRTPMNAIVGMTEIILRNPDIDKQNREYLMNISSSGNALLNIINDILDFSKIESGKLEIIEDYYNPRTMLNDLSMIFLTRIGEKPVELIYDIDPKLPAVLYGDPLRFRQVIINLLNNAIKFTEKGFVKLSIKVQLKRGENLLVDVAVEDSGQGIKKEDLPKLFASFQQVDTKRNREKEGTGLGLSISRQLVQLMGGDMSVESEYGRGSRFSFTIKQKCKGDEVVANIKDMDDEDIVISGYCSSPIVNETIRELAETNNFEFVEWDQALLLGARINYLFTDSILIKNNREMIMAMKAKGVEIIVLQNPIIDSCIDDEFKVINKPLYSINFSQIINHEEVEEVKQTKGYETFVAPDARILIVDDNEMNLKVAVGLLSPMQMHIDTAMSGRECLDLIEKENYHIIFMDHMMPVMDGVECTRYIREMDGTYYKDVPIIALTANAVVDARDGFIEAGMNDFIAKPIDMADMCSKLLTWLPKEIVTETGEVTLEQQVDMDLPEIENLNVADGVKYSGSKELFISLLGDFYKLIDLKSNKIEKCLADGLIRDYTIEVHALKNTARMIGASGLSDLCKQMEDLGNAGDVETLNAKTPQVLALYRSYKPILKPYGAQDDAGKEEIDSEQLNTYLDQIAEAIDVFDVDTADDAMKALDEYKLPQALQDDLEALRAYVADLAMQEILDTIAHMKSLL